MDNRLTLIILIGVQYITRDPYAKAIYTKTGKTWIYIIATLAITATITLMII